MSEHSHDCPHPTAGTLEQIEFVRKPMTDWLAPGQLARTGVKAGVASAFGAYADKRELQAALSTSEGVDDAYELENGELWFDYVADLGDGFDATYSVARLLASDLTLAFEGNTHDTRRGAFLLLGGDQVYPTAAHDEYQNRFLGPYRAALPWVVHDPAHGRFAPAIYALPGNHDWYDGLTAFLRIFCQRKSDDPASTGRWIGAWRTRQRRSYFALRLPQDWWIWAVDSQLGSDLDRPQLRYFGKLADSIPKEQRAQQKVILVTATPSWVNCPGAGEPKTCRRDVEAFNTLAHFEKTLIRAKGLQLKLVLSGDLHHYVRYTSDESPTTRITSGGGGAYLYGTELMPQTLAVREATHETMPVDAPLRKYVRRGSFPNVADSHEFADDVWLLPFRNRRFGALVGALYVLLAWLLQTCSYGVDFGKGYTSLVEYLHYFGAHGAGRAFLRAFFLSPLAFALAGMVIAGTYAFTASAAKGYGPLPKLLGLLHGIAHVLLCCALTAWISIGIHRLDPSFGASTLRFLLAVTLAIFAAGWFFGAWLFATYLWVTKRVTGVHAEELFSSMAIEDYKSFLRFRLDANGTLTVFAIGLRKVAHDWTFVAPGPEEHGAPWFRSKTFGSDAAHAPHVIERFEVGGRAQGAEGR